MDMWKMQRDVHMTSMPDSGEKNKYWLWQFFTRGRTDAYMTIQFNLLMDLLSRAMWR